MQYALEHPIAAYAGESARAAFIRRTYAHLAGAIGAFVALEFLIFSLFSQQDLTAAMQRVFSNPLSGLFVIGGFIAISWLATWWASSGASPALQYAGLALYVVAEALIFVPLLYMAAYVYVGDPNIIPTAGVLTLCVFGGLTAASFITRSDFSFLGPILAVASFVALGVIVCAFLFGFSLGLWFSLAMVVFASIAILYQTSNIIHHYRTDQHVAAALALFAAVAMLFYYILMALMQRR
jgi:FtsH-binding integral membrane protein